MRAGGSYGGDILDHPGLKGYAPGPILGLMLALCWPMLALSWPMLALSWPCVGPMLALCRPMSSDWNLMLAICETISVERIPTCQFVFPGPLRRTINKIKTTFFTFAKCGSAVVGGGSAAGPAYITFGYHRRPSGQHTGPAPEFKGLRVTAGRRQRKVSVGACCAHVESMLAIS